MKFLSKINRGLILTVLIIVAIVIYLVAQSISESKVTPKIKEVCQQYINTAINYSQLPEKYRKTDPEMPKAELDKYIENMTSDLKAFYTNNEQTYKSIVQRYKEDLENQAKGIGVVYSYKKDIKDYEDIIFDGNTVTVTIDTNSVLDGPNNLMPGAPREKVSAQTVDTITLQKTDGEWKVIYAFLQQPVKTSENQKVTYSVY
jgi:hypothetical protein